MFIDQYYQCHVTQPLLLEQLKELDIDISAGQLNNLLIEEKDRFHQEKDRILAVGLEVSAYINVDDTGARHKGKNGYCTHIGNESFSWFESTIGKRTTPSASLNLAFKRIYNNKSELIRALECPDTPLHNNGVENAIREYVKKRKISGSTRSEFGRQSRDTFTSLKKTCRKLGVSFWQYLKDRIENTGLIPDLSNLIRQHSLNPG